MLNFICIILFSVLYLIFWCHFFLLPGGEHGVGREFLIYEDAAFVTPFCPRLVFGNAVLAHLHLQPLPTKMGRNSVCPQQVSNFCGFYKPSIPPVYLQLSTTLYQPSWAAVHSTFFLSAFSLPLYIIFRWSRSVTTTVNKSQRWQAFACRLF